jgi:hypothetical protein
VRRVPPPETVTCEGLPVELSALPCVVALPVSVGVVVVPGPLVVSCVTLVVASVLIYVVIDEVLVLLVVVLALTVAGYEGPA